MENENELRFLDNRWIARTGLKYMNISECYIE